MTKTVDVDYILGGLEEGAKACVDLADVFMDIGDLVVGGRRTITKEAIRRFRLVADIVDPLPGREDSDERRKVLAAIREGRAAVNALEAAGGVGEVETEAGETGVLAAGRVELP